MGNCCAKGSGSGSGGGGGSGGGAGGATPAALRAVAAAPGYRHLGLGVGLVHLAVLGEVRDCIVLVAAYRDTELRNVKVLTGRVDLAVGEARGVLGAEERVFAKYEGGGVAALGRRGNRGNSSSSGGGMPKLLGGAEANDRVHQIDAAAEHCVKLCAKLNKNVGSEALRISSDLQARLRSFENLLSREFARREVCALTQLQGSDGDGGSRGAPKVDLKALDLALQAALGPTMVRLLPKMMRVADESQRSQYIRSMSDHGDGVLRAAVVTLQSGLTRGEFGVLCSGESSIEKARDAIARDGDLLLVGTRSSNHHESLSSTYSGELSG